MKIILLPLFALAALAIAPNVVRATTSTTKPAVTVDLRDRFNAVCDELAKKAAARGATRADFNQAVEAVRAAANQYLADDRQVQSIRDRLIERINQLEVRAREAALDVAEFDVLKDLLIDLDLSGALWRMRAQVLEGKATRLDWTMCYNALTLRAEAAKADDSQMDAIVDRLRTEIDRLQKRAADVVKQLTGRDFEPMAGFAADVLDRVAVNRFEKRALKLKLKIVVQDYSDVQDALAFGGVDAASDLGRRVAARLEELKAAVIGGRITRADFESLRDLLYQRARAVSSAH